MPIVLPDEIRRYEESGLLLHPCKDKKPVFAGWQEIASSDPAKNEEWFAVYRYNVGLLTGERNGIVVLDFDDLEMAREFFKQFREKIRAIMQTPRPGIHFPFRHPGGHVGNAVKMRIGNLLADIRGDGGYVVSPPSMNHGYHFVDGFELDPKKLEVFDPRWIEQKEVKRQKIEEDDTMRRIYRAMKWAEKVEPAVEHKGWHNKLFYFCCAMFQKFGLTVDQAYPLILAYNQKCKPPMCPDGLKHKIEDALAKATNP